MKMKENASEFAGRLRRLLAKNQWTRAKLSAESGVSYRAIINLMDGVNLPQPTTAGKIAQALGTSPEYLIHGNDAPDVVREKPSVYGVSLSRALAPSESGPRDGGTVEYAIRIISRQFGVDEKKAMEAICGELLKIKTGVTKNNKEE